MAKDNERAGIIKVIFNSDLICGTAISDEAMDLLVDLVERVDMDDLVDEFIKNDGDTHDYFFELLDSGMIYTADQWTMLEMYCDPQNCNFEEAWYDLLRDVEKVAFAYYDMAKED